MKNRNFYSKNSK